MVIRSNATKIDAIFNQYFSPSTKDHERTLRDELRKMYAERFNWQSAPLRFPV